MSDQASAPGGAGGAAESRPEVTAEDHEAAMMRQVMRIQERHREGGVDPDLDDTDADGDQEPCARTDELGGHTPGSRG
jgi:hypothetical protein